MDRSSGVRVPVVVRPELWADPRALLAGTETERIVLPSSTGSLPALVVPADPARFMLLWVAGAATGYYVAPWPEVDQYRGFPLAGGNPTILRFTLFDYGPIITNSWYITPVNGPPPWVFTTKRIGR